MTELNALQGFKGKKAVYYTLGCKLNFSETSTFARMLGDAGVTEAKDGEKADICLVNTCSVTDVADQKCRHIIRHLIRENPGAFVVVTGCYAQLKPHVIADIDGVSLVLGANEKARLMEYLNNVWNKGDGRPFCHTERTKDITAFQPSCSRGDRTRYFLEGAGRMQLLLHILHYSLCARQLPESDHSLTREAGRAGSKGRRKGNCADRRQYRRFR